MTRSAPGPIDRLVEEYGRQGRWAELGGVLDGMDRQGLSDPDHVAWYHVRGIVEYRLNQRARAREIFEEAVRQFPNSDWLNYGLGQEYEFEGRIDEMAACFERVRLADVGGAGVLAMARYCYLWDRLELAQRAIRPIFNAYHELKIVDDTFLYLRGLPGFGEAFGYLATLSWLGGQFEVALTELARARAELQEYNFERLGLDLEATASGDWEPVIADLDAFPVAGPPVSTPPSRNSTTYRSRQMIMRGLAISGRWLEPRPSCHARHCCSSRTTPSISA